jgi:hypothetical protein
MENNKVEINGEWYELVPLAKKKEKEKAISYYGCDSACGLFCFTALLHEDGTPWDGSESVDYFKDGFGVRATVETWDGGIFLNNIVDNPTNEHVAKISELITENQGEFEDLVHLITQVREQGWLHNPSK